MEGCRRIEGMLFGEKSRFLGRARFGEQTCPRNDNFQEARMKQRRMRTSSGRKDAKTERPELVELMRARMRENAAIEHLDFDLESVGKGTPSSPWTSSPSTSNCMEWSTADF